MEAPRLRFVGKKQWNDYFIVQDSSEIIHTFYTTCEPISCVRTMNNNNKAVQKSDDELEALKKKKTAEKVIEKKKKRKADESAKKS